MAIGKYLKYFPLFLVIRTVLCLFVVRNYDHPDEYWQGAEIAHKIFYGYGYETWEWTSQQPIRSHLFPLILCIPYKILQILGIATPDLIAIAPRFYQIVVSAIFDFFLILLADLYEPKSAWKMTILNYTSWASLTFMSRTFINSTQATLTLISFYLWVRRKQLNGWKFDLISRALVVLCYVMRQTTVLFWAVVWPYQLFTMKGQFGKRILFVLKNILTVGLMVGSSIGFAYLWYGSFQFIEWNFYYYNIQLDWATLYGKFPVFSYFYLFLPLILSGHLIFYYKGLKSLYGGDESSESLKQNQNPSTIKLKQCFILTMLIMIVMSTSKHKQTRFLLVLLPLYLVICLRGYDSTPRFVKLLSILINLSLFLGFNVIGKAGPIESVSFLRNQPSVTSILFLTQCHSTPFYSVLHKDVPTRFPTCSPLQRVQNRDENTRLWRDPAVLYQQMLQYFREPPSHMVVQSKFQDKFGIDRGEYEKVAEFGNSGVMDTVFFGRDGLGVWRRRRGNKEGQEGQRGGKKGKHSRHGE